MVRMCIAQHCSQVDSASFKGDASIKAETIASPVFSTASHTCVVALGKLTNGLEATF